MADGTLRFPDITSLPVLCPDAEYQVFASAREFLGRQGIDVDRLTGGQPLYLGELIPSAATNGGSEHDDQYW